ncbi:hypothetical protein C8R47DRAFT_376588 [Mycena vitilis]|nr:hypothetical protein C8R47DRAFT_376588 [Mycena vitilis]
MDRSGAKQERPRFWLRWAPPGQSAFSGGRKQQGLCLRHLPRPSPSQYRHLCLDAPLGWRGTCEMHPECQWSDHYPRQPDSLHRLAAPRRLSELYPRLATRVLWLWPEDTRRSGLSSSRETLRLYHPTIQGNGTAFSPNWACFKSIPAFPCKYSVVLTSASPKLIALSLPPINPQLILISSSSSASSTTNSPKIVTSGLSLRPRSRTSWGLSNPLPSHLFPSQGDQTDCDLSKIFPSRIHRPPSPPQLIIESTRICTHAPGAPSLPSASKCGSCLRDRKVPYVMSLKPIAPSGFYPPNGPDSSCVSTMIHLLLILLRALVWVQRQASMAPWPMQELTSSVLRESDLCLNGLTTMYSYEFCFAIWRSITESVVSQQLTLLRTAADSRAAAGIGTMQGQCQMVGSLNATRTTLSPYKTYQSHRSGPRKTHASATTSMMSIASRRCSGSHGSFRKTYLSARMSASRGLSFTWLRSESPFHFLKRRSTWEPSSHGFRSRHTLTKRSVSSMASSCIPPWYGAVQGELTSLDWRPCLGSSIIVLSSRSPLPGVFGMTSFGGGRFSASETYRVPSLGRTSSTIPTRIPMPVLQSVLALPLLVAGGLGGSSPIGNPTTATLGGQRQSDLSSSFKHSSHPALLPAISRFSATTEVLSRDGGKDVAVIPQPMASSSAFTPLRKTQTLPYTLDMFPPKPTPQMDRHGESFPRTRSFSQL